jgi:hypothetical protein
MVTKSPPGKKIALYTTIAVLFAVLLGLTISNTLKLSGLQSDLNLTEENLYTTQNILNDTHITLSLTELDLTQAQSDLTISQQNLGAKQKELRYAADELDTTKTTLAQTQRNYTDTLAAFDTEKAANTKLQDQLTVLSGTYATKTDGYDYVYRDPTYQEVKDFLASDTTNTKPYVVGTYVCENFSADVTANAQKIKIRAGCVQLVFPVISHALIAFNTTDRGIVYFEPQTDEEVVLQIGKHYWSQCIIAAKGKYSIPTDYDDTVRSFSIIW